MYSQYRDGWWDHLSIHLYSGSYLDRRLIVKKWWNYMTDDVTKISGTWTWEPCAFHPTITYFTECFQNSRLILQNPWEHKSNCNQCWKIPDLRFIYLGKYSPHEFLSICPDLGHLLIANIKRVPQSAGGIVSQYRRIGYIEEGVHLEDNNNILLNILKN